jgi:molybdate transport system ATP-binding protein
MQRRLDILPYLEKLHQHADFPIIYVSHSLPEIARLADFVLLMKKGKVLASGSASHVLTRLDLPITKNEESCAILDTQVVEQQPQWNLMKVTFEGGYLWLPISAPTGSHIRVSVLARDVSLSLHQQKDSSILNSVKVQLDEINTDTDATFAMVRLKIANQYLLSRTTRKSLAHLAVQPGDILWAQIKSAAIVHG